MTLAPFEQETIINFNREEKVAYIYTCEKTWQKHLEGKLGLKPIMKNEHGGREYIIDKKRIPMPRAPRKLSADQRKAIGKRLHNTRNSAKTIITKGKSADEKK